ncbi:hypothetical protein SBDP1_320022 [Syntrophobacter sp. SbD1]|nr:hypothetical protein SBDP1_320022 [Syntrophobacter sp. SbD1]
MYDLRHLFTSVLRHEGAVDKSVADMLGHGNENTMKKHYTHTMKGALETAISFLPSIIKKEIPTRVEEFPLFPLGKLLANLVSQCSLN